MRKIWKIIALIPALIIFIIMINTPEDKNFVPYD